MEQDSLKKEIAKLVDDKKGPELWREAVRTAVKHNPTIAEEVLLTIRENRELREDLHDQKYGTNKTGSMRMGMRIPFSIEAILATVDPDHWPLSNDNGYKKTLKQMQKVLPEFFIPSSY